MTDDKKKPLDIIRIETEPPDYQAVVVRGIGWFRMPSEETMTDDPHPASAAWQDELRWARDWVSSLATPERPDPSGWSDVAWLEYWRGQRTRVRRVLEARAADAQQIAALREDVRRKDETITLLMGRVEDLEGRIGNALA